MMITRLSMHLQRGEKIRNFGRDHLRYIHTPRPAPRSRETRFEKRRPAKVPEPQPFEESLRFLGLGRERAQFLELLETSGTTLLNKDEDRLLVREQERKQRLAGRGTGYYEKGWWLSGKGSKAAPFGKSRETEKGDAKTGGKDKGSKGQGRQWNRGKGLDHQWE